VSLAFKLVEVEFAYASLGPKVGGKSNLGKSLAVKIESECLHSPRGEVIAHYYCIIGHGCQRLHGHIPGLAGGFCPGNISIASP
jgi:hypothetical protein